MDADNPMKRRAFLMGAAAAVASSAAQAAHPGKTVGAIRWDAWYKAGNTGVTAAVAAALGYSSDPVSGANFQSRAPSCATAINSYSISLDGCDSQAQIDAEIAAARGAGLDYWAYCWYGTTNPLQKAWVYHQASAIKAQMNWCLIVGYSQLVTAASAPAEFVGYFKQANYQSVLSGRPLIYALPDSTTNAALGAAITSLRSACATAGVGNPYIALMSGPVAGILSATGADAISSYGGTTGARPVAAPYSALVAQTESYWDIMAATGQNSIPCAITGKDRRPRILRPMPWETSGVGGHCSACGKHAGMADHE
jgi:hypothetical protein